MNFCCKEDSAEENETSGDTMIAECEGTKIEKIKKQHRPRQVNRAPALYNARCVKHDNEVFLNGGKKEGRWTKEAESNNLPGFSRITIFYTMLQEESGGRLIAKT